MIVLVDWLSIQLVAKKGKGRSIEKEDQLKDVVWQEGKEHVEEMQSRTDFLCVTN